LTSLWYLMFGVVRFVMVANIIASTWKMVCVLLSSSPLLAEIMKGFVDYIPDHYDQNYFLNLARQASQNGGAGNPSNALMSFLQMYEDLVGNDDIQSLPGKTKNDIYARMRSFDSVINKGILRELLVYIQLKRSSAVEKVDYVPETGRHDFIVTLTSGEIINLELTGRGKLIGTENIEKAYKRVAKEIMKSFPDGKYLRLDIRPYTLLDEHDYFEEEHIVNVLLQRLNEVSDIIFAAEGYCHMEHNFGDPAKPLIDFKEIFHDFREFGERLELLEGTAEGLDYLQRTPVSALVDHPVSGFGFTSGAFALVEIHSLIQYPHKIDRLEEDLLLNQLLRKVKEKIEKGQLEQKDNPVIAIRFDPFRFIRYSVGTELLSMGALDKLKKVIEQAFKETGNEIISGVFLFESSLLDGTFVENPLSQNGTLVSQLMQKVITNIPAEIHK